MAWFFFIAAGVTWSAAADQQGPEAPLDPEDQDDETLQRMGAEVNRARRRFDDAPAHLRANVGQQLRDLISARRLRQQELLLRQQARVLVLEQAPDDPGEPDGHNAVHLCLGQSLSQADTPRATCTSLMCNNRPCVGVRIGAAASML